MRRSALAAAAIAVVLVGISPTALEAAKPDPLTIIVGGESVVSPAVVGEVRTLLGGNEFRVAGFDRYETAVRISESFTRDSAMDWPGRVYVSTGENFPDALAAGPIAAAYDAPMLLVRRDSVPPSVIEEINRLRAIEIVILGGPGAVSTAVEAELGAETGASVSRIGGTDRYATAAAIAEFWTRTDSTVYIATGENFPDALAGGAAASMDVRPILLVQHDRIPPPTVATLLRLSPAKIVIFGGTGAISQSVESELSGYAATVERWAGSDRYSTAAEICAHAFRDDPTFYPYRVFIATGENFPDALAAVPAAYRAPILLVRQDTVPAATATELVRLSEIP